MNLRKILENNARRLRTDISSATKFRIGEDKPLAEKVQNLTTDIRNIPSHIFGEHQECQAIAYFKCSREKNEINYIPIMRECGLMEDVEVCLNRLINNATSLITNMDTNIAEQYNSIICKFVGGKRINFSLKRSYETRCKAAAISFNTEKEYYDTLSDKTPVFTKKFEEKAKRKNLLRKVGRKTFHKIFKPVSRPDSDYGPDAVPDPDLPEDQYQNAKIQFLKSLKKTPEELKELEMKTRGQSNNPFWQQERMLRLTASNFGEVCKMRQKTSCVSKVKQLLYNTFKGSDSTRYGLEHESFAVREFENQFNLKVN